MRPCVQRAAIAVLLAAVGTAGAVVGLALALRFLAVPFGDGQAWVCGQPDESDGGVTVGGKPTAADAESVHLSQPTAHLSGDQIAGAGARADRRRACGSRWRLGTERPNP